MTLTMINVSIAAIWLIVALLANRNPQAVADAILYFLNRNRAFCYLALFLLLVLNITTAYYGILWLRESPVLGFSTMVAQGLVGFLLVRHQHQRSMRRYTQEDHVLFIRPQ